MWRNVSAEMVFHLVEAVVGRLRDMEQGVVTSTCRVRHQHCPVCAVLAVSPTRASAHQLLSTLPHILGESVFDAHVSHMHSSLKQLYRNMRQSGLDTQGRVVGGSRARGYGSRGGGRPCVVTGMRGGNYSFCHNVDGGMKWGDKAVLLALDLSPVQLLPLQRRRAAYWDPG